MVGFSVENLEMAPPDPRPEQPVHFTGNIKLLGLPYLLLAWVIVSVTYPEKWWEEIFPIWGSPTVRRMEMAVGGNFEVHFPQGFNREGEYEFGVRVYAGPSMPIDALVLPFLPPVATETGAFSVAGAPYPKDTAMVPIEIDITKLEATVPIEIDITPVPQLEATVPIEIDITPVPHLEARVPIEIDITPAPVREAVVPIEIDIRVTIRLVNPASQPHHGIPNAWNVGIWITDVGPDWVWEWPQPLTTEAHLPATTSPVRVCLQLVYPATGVWFSCPLTNPITLVAGKTYCISGAHCTEIGATEIYEC